MFSLYTSGSTGKPKGVSREVNLSPLPYKAEEDDLGLTRVVQGLYSADEDSVYLSPAPLYHSAPMGFNTGFLALGATSIILEKFDPKVVIDTATLTGAVIVALGSVAAATWQTLSGGPFADGCD